MHEVVIRDPGAAATCRISIDRGQLAEPEPTQFLPERDERGAAAVLAQPTTLDAAVRLAEAFETGGVRSAVRVVPDRDAAKSPSEVERLYRWLNELHISRDDTLVAVGGGALTDVAGFVAGTYLRGIEAVYAPTTLLAAVDAAIGGKTGINVGGKNLAGMFKHPARVVIDVGVLERLPETLLREGAAEAVKAGFIADTGILELYEAEGLEAPLEEIVVRSVTVKAEVVNDDFLEQGRRAILNYGHTIGHAVEVAASLPHGDSVAIGMVAAGAASEQVLGFTGGGRQRDLLRRLGLPVAAPPLDRTQVEALVALDKKRGNEGLRMVLLEDFERPTVRAVDPATVGAALAAVGVI